MKEEELKKVGNSELLDVFTMLKEFLDNLETLKKKVEEPTNEK
jgi:hypothetical protein